MTIEGKNINLELVQLEDAEFIYKLRTDENKSRFLSKISGTVKDQEEWIKKYKEREKQGIEYYFIIKSKNGEKLGTVRLYDFKGDSFCWGSWIIKENAPKFAAIESALQVYEFAFYKLGFKRSHFDVRKQNIKVVNFHKKFGAKIVREDDLNYYFEFSKEDYEKIKPRYRKFL